MGVGIGGEAPSPLQAPHTLHDLSTRGVHQIPERPAIDSKRKAGLTSPAARNVQFIVFKGQFSETE